MAAIWKRTTNIMSMSSSYPSLGNIVNVTSSPHGYYTDDKIGVTTDEIQHPTNIGSLTAYKVVIQKPGNTDDHNVAYEVQVEVFAAAGNPDPNYRDIAKRTRQGTPNTIGSKPFENETWTRSVNLLEEIPFVQVEAYLRPYLTYWYNLPSTPYDDTQELEAAGTYTATQTGSAGTVSLGTMEFRTFALKQFSVTTTNSHTFNISAPVFAYPANSSTWNIDQPVKYQVTIQPLGKISPIIISGQITAPPGGFPIQSSGQFALIQASWNGTNGNGEIEPGSYSITVRATLQHGSSIYEGQSQSQAKNILDTGFSQVVTIPPEPIEEKTKKLRKSDCENGNVNREGQAEIPILIATGFDGTTDTSVALVARGANSSNLPASFGYGWGLSKDEKLSLAGSQVIYTHNSNQVEAWNISGSSYIPAFPDNYTVLTKEVSDQSLTLTFKDKTVKNFFPLSGTNQGKLRWEKDRNGNTTYYHYDSGKLVAWSDAVDVNGDPDGRVVRIEYSTSSPQPSKIVSELRSGGSVVAQRETTFSLHTSTNISAGYLQNALKSVTNPEGETTTFLYYADGSDYRISKIKKILDPRGHTVVEYDYHDDAQVRVKKETTYYVDQSSQVVPKMTREFTYDTDQITTVVTDLTGRSAESVRQTVFNYNTSGQLVSREDTIGSTTNLTAYQYTDSSNPYKVTRVIDPKLEYEDRTYNSRGNILTIDNKNREVTTLAYSSSDPDLLESITYPSVTVPDPNNPGQTISEQYQTVFGYDAKNNLASVTQTTGPVGANQTATTYFRIRNGVDHAATDGQLWKVVDRRWDGNPATEDNYAVIYDYYTDGNLKSIQTPAGPGSHPSQKLTFEYDHFDNVTKVTDLLGNEWNSVFDDLDRLIESEDARGKKSYADYADGLLTEVHGPANLGPSGAQSRDVGQSRTGRTVKFTHDYMGRTVKTETNDSSTTFLTRSEVDFTGFSELYTLARQINGNTKTNTWSYDQLGRVTEMIDSLGRASSREYQPYCGEFDDTSPRGIAVKSTFDKLCRPSSVEALNEDMTYDYDELGRLVLVTKRRKTVYSDGTDPNLRGARWDEDDVYDGVLEEWKFEYDPLGRMTKVVHPQGEEILYEYGAVGELLQVTDADTKVTRYEYNYDLSLSKVIIERSGQADREFIYSYDAGGRMTQIAYPDGLTLYFDDGTNPGWNANGQLTAMRWLQGSTLIRSFQYDYDDSGNRIQALESNGTPAQDVEWQYRYDWLDRLVQVKKGIGGATPAVQKEYVYDESDNRTYMDDFQNGLTFWYTYKTVGSSPVKYSDELAEIQVATGTGKRTPADLADFTSLETFVTDDDGNTVSRTTSAGTVSYTWDDFNNLLSVALENGQTTENSYDAGSIREEMTKDSGEKVRSFYSGMPTVNETSTTNGNTSYFLGHQLLGYEHSGNRLYFITDGLSSVRAVVNSSGTEVASFSHDEYGNQLSATGTSPKTWVGGLGVHDDTADTRLLYMRRRHYDPTIGRFLNRDPIGLSGGLNLYNYGANSPVNYVDPSGLNPAGAPDGPYGFTQKEWTIIRDAMHQVKRFDPAGGTGGFFRAGQVQGMWDTRPGRKAKTNVGWGGNRQVFLNRHELDGVDNYYEAIVDVTASLANELWHVRNGMEAPWSSASADFEIQLMENWADHLFSELDKIGYYDKGCPREIRNSPEVQAKVALQTAVNSYLLKVGRW